MKNPRPECSKLRSWSRFYQNIELKQQFYKWQFYEYFMNYRILKQHLVYSVREPGASNLHCQYRTQVLRRSSKFLNYRKKNYKGGGVYRLGRRAHRIRKTCDIESSLATRSRSTQFCLGKVGCRNVGPTLWNGYQNLNLQIRSNLM